MIQALDNGKEVTIPLARAGDLERVGAVAASFAALLERSLEVLVVVDPEDDFLADFKRFGAAVEEFAESTGQPVDLHMIASDVPLQAVLDACRGRLVCMATAATPFQADHYVGSYAAALLAETTAPVILVGPAVERAQGPVERVVVAVSAAVDGHPAMVTGGHLARAAGAPLAKVVIDPKGVVYETDFHDMEDGLADEVHATMTQGPLDPQQIAHELVERSSGGVLVLATRANRGLSWICEGSVAFDAIGETPGPVVAVGPQAFAEDHTVVRSAPSREVELASPGAAAAAEELDERIRFLRKVTSATYRARPRSMR